MSDYASEPAVVDVIELARGVRLTRRGFDSPDAWWPSCALNRMRTEGDLRGVLAAVASLCGWLGESAAREWDSVRDVEVLIADVAAAEASLLAAREGLAVHLAELYRDGASDA